jgi:hypothetical protein
VKDKKKEGEKRTEIADPIRIKRDQVHKPDSIIKNMGKEESVYVYMIVCVCQKERKREKVK